MRNISSTSRNKIPLIEAAIAAVILVIASVYIASAFVKSDELKGEAKALSEAVIRCEDMAERLHLSVKSSENGYFDTPLGCFEISLQEMELYSSGYDKEWMPVRSDPEYLISVSGYREEAGASAILYYKVRVLDSKGKVLAELPSSCVIGLGE